MLDLLGERAYTLELAVGGSETELIFRHGLGRRNELVFQIEDSMVQHHGDRPTFFFRLGRLPGSRNCQHQQPAYYDSDFLPHDPPRSFPSITAPTHLTSKL